MRIPQNVVRSIRAFPRPVFPLGIGLIALAVVVLGLPNSARSGVGTTFWFDDFDDADVNDLAASSPAGATWTPNPITGFGEAFAGEYNATSGDLFFKGHDQQGVFFDNDDEVLIASVESHTFSNGVSVRVVGQISPFGALGVLGNAGTLFLQTYYGLHHVDAIDDGMGNPAEDGGIEIELFDGANQIRIEFIDEGGFVPIAAPDSVVVQLDIYNGVLTYRHWKAGDPQSSAVVQTFMDSTFTSGVAAIIFNEDEFNGLLEGSALVSVAKASSVRLIDGDMDGDGDTDFDDIDDFVQGLNDPAGYEATFGLPPYMLGDTDNDGDQDFDDIPVFVSILTGGALQSIPEPSTLFLGVTGLIGLLALRRRT